MECFAGVDIVSVKRIEKDINKKSFLNKIFTENELKCLNKKNAQTIAGRFAGKEATMKCMGRGIDFFLFTDIEIFKNENGKPYIVLSNKAKEYAKQLGLCEIDISISHEEDYAVAFAVGK